MHSKRFSYKCAALFSVTLFLLIYLMIHGPITTPERYLTMADQRSWLGIPNAWNVLSNLPFIILGITGISLLLQKRKTIAFFQNQEQLFYYVFFVGIFLVGFGSSYYHIYHTNFSLMWDRLPITIAVMAFLAAMIAERIDRPFASGMLIPFLALGLWSVYYWYFTVELGREDLRPYTFVLSFFPLVIVPMILLLFKSPYTKVKYLWLAILFFVVARVTETFDLAIYQRLHHFVSGHTLKHLILAFSCFLIFLYLKNRTRLTPQH